jgi:hypothetical protein
MILNNWDIEKHIGMSSDYRFECNVNIFDKAIVICQSKVGSRFFLFLSNWPKNINETYNQYQINLSYRNENDNRLNYNNGYPTLYHKFISNVILNDVQDIIYPFPYPSATAFKILNKLFNKHNIKADFIFVDGSHEEIDVYLDLYYYFFRYKIFYTQSMPFLFHFYYPLLKTLLTNHILII